MQARLLCKTGTLTGRGFMVSDQTTIGKDGSNTIALPHRLISRKHARIYFDDAEKSYFLEDLNSRNGTRLDGERVVGRERLETIHVITLGNRFDFFFQLFDKNAEVPGGMTTETADLSETLSTDAGIKTEHSQQEAANLTRLDANPIAFPEQILAETEREQTMPNLTKSAIEKTVEASQPAGSNTTLITDPETKFASSYAIFVEGISQAFQLKEGVNLVGRGQDCDVTINHETISRHHARVTVRDDVISLQDLSSKNKTFVAKKEVTEMVEITPNSQLRFGKVKAVLKFYVGR